METITARGGIAENGSRVAAVRQGRAGEDVEQDVRAMEEGATVVVRDAWMAGFPLERIHPA